jgi:arabinose-5-phosphate isomerase
MSNNVVKEKMLGLNNFPVLTLKDSLKKTLDQMTAFRIGIACFVDDEGVLIGILTDGDLRRLLLNKQDPLPSLLVSPGISFGNIKSTTVKPETLCDDALAIMKRLRVWDLPVIDNDLKLLGIYHLEID